MEGFPDAPSNAGGHPTGANRAPRGVGVGDGVPTGVVAPSARGQVV